MELGKRLRGLLRPVHLPVARRENSVEEGVVREAEEATLEQLDCVGMAPCLVVRHRDIEGLPGPRIGIEAQRRFARRDGVLEPAEPCQYGRALEHTFGMAGIDS